MLPYWRALSSEYDSGVLPWGLRQRSRRSLLQCGRHGFDPWVGKIPWRRKWQPTPVFWPGKSHRQRAWQATVHGVAKSQIRLSDFTHSRMTCVKKIIDSASAVNLLLSTSWILLLLSAYGQDVSMESGGSVISKCREQFWVDLWWEVAWMGGVHSFL